MLFVCLFPFMSGHWFFCFRPQKDCGGNGQMILIKEWAPWYHKMAENGNSKRQATILLKIHEGKCCLYLVFVSTFLHHSSGKWTSLLNTLSQSACFVPCQQQLGVFSRPIYRGSCINALKHFHWSVVRGINVPTLHQEMTKKQSLSMHASAV